MSYIKIPNSWWDVAPLSSIRLWCDMSGESTLRGRYTESALRLETKRGARCSSVVRAFAHGTMGRRIDPSLWTH